MALPAHPEPARPHQTPNVATVEANLELGCLLRPPGLYRWSKDSLEPEFSRATPAVPANQFAAAWPENPDSPKSIDPHSAPATALQHPAPNRACGYRGKSACLALRWLKNRPADTRALLSQPHEPVTWVAGWRARPVPLPCRFFVRLVASASCRGTKKQG